MGNVRLNQINNYSKISHCWIGLGSNSIVTNYSICTALLISWMVLLLSSVKWFVDPGWCYN